ncbi:histone-lysine N-methyltransferase SETMAR [Plakobranchus ocellatus]|uniref:Histone-lysine N-methyltransferase SETMAR n=1 Tax=Plakobranchus ocellatus TaxID=259542 RepID=A0AAV4C8Y6_9GAST|nr:histone-lysine N-methyltransferase SETMAR [Plakobranchus ocellatus]
MVVDSGSDRADFPGDEQAIRRKRRELLRRGVVLQHDNATPHSANLTQQWLQRYGWEILPHPAHSPDLPPSDFHLFGPLKRHLGEWLSRQKMTSSPLQPSPPVQPLPPSSPQKNLAFHSEELRYYESFHSDSSVYDMNELPYMSQSRTLLLVICVIMFFGAACVYMPLGYIQLRQSNSFHTGGVGDSKIVYFPCSSKLFGLHQTGHWAQNVSAEFKLSYGDCSRNSIRKGGVLMLVYAFFFTICLGLTIACTALITLGYQNTCQHLRGLLLSPDIACGKLNSRHVRFKDDDEGVIVKDIDKSVQLAKVASGGLVAMSALQIIITLSTFGMIWYYFHYLAVHLTSSDQSRGSPAGFLDDDDDDVD